MLHYFHEGLVKFVETLSYENFALAMRRQLWCIVTIQCHGNCTTVQVKVDLKALASECIPELNLEEELQKQLLPSPPPSPAREKSVKLNYTQT